MACCRKWQRGRRHRTEDATSVAFERLYVECESELYEYLARRLDAETAETTTAAVFAAAWQQYPTRNSALDDRTWVLGIALVHLEQHRGTELAYLEHLAAGHHGHGVARALAELDPLDRDMLTLHIWAGIEHESIGVMTGVSAAVARRRIDGAYSFVERRAGAA